MKEERLQQPERKKQSLDEQYKLAAKEEERNQEFKQWEHAFIEDGLNETKA